MGKEGQGRRGRAHGTEDDDSTPTDERKQLG
jgi:hypothetical protein